MKPELRSVVFDSRKKLVGEVMGFEGPYIQLRPLKGGMEWDADPKDLRPAAARGRPSAPGPADRLRRLRGHEGPELELLF
ncbi:hypothetical protein RB200_41605 [Streptomyces sp. PmtG]